MSYTGITTTSVILSQLPATAPDISRAINVNVSMVSAILWKLAKRGLVEKVTDKRPTTWDRK